jgi:hypothetical protein
LGKQAFQPDLSYISFFFIQLNIYIYIYIKKAKEGDKDELPAAQEMIIPRKVIQKVSPRTQRTSCAG